MHYQSTFTHREHKEINMSEQTQVSVAGATVVSDTKPTGTARTALVTPERMGVAMQDIKMLSLTKEVPESISKKAQELKTTLNDLPTRLKSIAADNSRTPDMKAVVHQSIVDEARDDYEKQFSALQGDLHSIRNQLSKSLYQNREFSVLPVDAALMPIYLEKFSTPEGLVSAIANERNHGVLSHLAHSGLIDADSTFNAMNQSLTPEAYKQVKEYDRIIESMTGNMVSINGVFDAVAVEPKLLENIITRIDKANKSLPRGR